MDHAVSSDWLYNQLFPFFLYPTKEVTLTASIFLTVAISHERYIAIQKPIIHRQLMKSSKSRWLLLMKYIIPIIIASILINVPHFLKCELPGSIRIQALDHYGGTNKSTTLTTWIPSRGCMRTTPEGKYFNWPIMGIQMYTITYYYEYLHTLM